MLKFKVMSGLSDDELQLRQEADQLRLFLKSIDDNSRRSLRKIDLNYDKIIAFASTKGYNFSRTCLQKALSTDDMGNPVLRVPGWPPGDIYDRLLGNL